MPDADPQNSYLIEAQKYAWNSFEYHAKQRMDVFRFYLIVVGLSVVGASRFAEEKSGLFAILIFIFLIITTIIFYRLDIRGKELVKLSERYLMYYEKLMAMNTSCNLITIICDADKQSDDKKKNGKWYERNLYSFSQLFMWIYWSVAVFCFFAIAYIVSREFR